MRLSGFALFLFAAFILYNIGTFALYGADKRRAQRGEWRIKERTLLLAAALFGALGALLGMLLFRHKTRHTLFRILVPLFCLLQAGIAIYLLAQ
ncbi:MAG: DUF1294 domain-containing protein [Bacillota bacterium]